jgi:hypothetical protein
MLKLCQLKKARSFYLGQTLSPYKFYAPPIPEPPEPDPLVINGAGNRGLTGGQRRGGGKLASFGHKPPLPPVCIE